MAESALIFLFFCFSIWSILSGHACPLCHGNTSCHVESKIELTRPPFLIIDHSINTTFVQTGVLIHFHGQVGDPLDFELERTSAVLYDSQDANRTAIPFQISGFKHRHRLRKKSYSILPLSIRMDKESVINSSNLVFEILSLQHGKCSYPLILNISVMIPLSSESEDDRKAEKMTQSEDSTNFTDSPPLMNCGVPFTLASTVSVDSHGVALIDMQVNFSFNDSFTLHSLFYEFCQDCTTCMLNLTEADVVRFCSPGIPSSHDCHLPSHHVLIRHPVTKLTCLGVALCGISNQAEFDIDGAVIGAEMQTVSTRVIAIEPPLRSLGRSMRTYLGYGILLTILFIFTFFTALSRCRYGPETIKMLDERDRWEIDDCDVQLCSDRRLASAEHHSTYLGVLSTTEASTHDNVALLGNYHKVVVRVLHRTAPICAHRRFMHELRILKMLGSHPRLVQMIGAVTLTEPRCIVSHYYSSGDLLSYLRQRASYMLRLRALGIDLGSCSSVDLDHFVAVQELFKWAIEIAAGMEYLSSRGIVHRSLTARKVFVDELRGARVGGLHCARVEGTDEATAKPPSLPIKWMAPESLRYLAFTSASDVWSFGVVLYELFTLGAPPYPFMHSSLVHPFLLKGNRLPRPAQCNLQLYALISSTWRYVPAQRPTFSHIRHTLQALAMADAEDAASPFFVKVDDAVFLNDITSPEQKNLSVILEDDEDKKKSADDLIFA